MTKRLHELTRGALACVSLLGFLGCESDSQPRGPLPDWSKGYPEDSAQVADGPLKDSFAFVIPDTLKYVARLGQKTDLSKPCSISRTAKHAEIECLADANELDLWVLGFQYDIHVPKDMCDFVLHVPYMFANFEMGVGPTKVAWTVHMDGTFSNEVNAENGKPACQFDYSRADKRAPNCCFGSYTATITSAESKTSTITTGDWGGKRGDCYYGAAYLEDEKALDADGVPMPRYIYTNREEYVEHTTYKGVSDKYPSNVALANYWNPDDHEGGTPSALSATGSRPYYEAYCLDDAEEIIAHIRMLVREWNEEAEFDKMGNPDTTGVEPDFDNGPRDIDDVLDWKALKAESRDRYPSFPLVK